MKRIVIVDDSLVSGLLLKHLLNRLPGVSAIAFQEPYDCLAECSRNRPDAVVVDYKMPSVDGLTFMAALRRLPGNEDTPVIFVTGELGVQERALFAGAAAVLGKPVEPAFVQETVARLLDVPMVATPQPAAAPRPAVAG